MKNKMKIDLYGLDCPYFTETFPTIEALIGAALDMGMDPNYEITKNGRPTGELLFDQMEM